MERDIEKEFLVETEKDNKLLEKENKALEEMKKELQKKNKLIDEINASKESIESADFFNDIQKLDTSYPWWSNELKKFIYDFNWYTYQNKFSWEISAGYKWNNYITIFDALGLIIRDEPGIYMLTDKGKSFLLHSRLPEDERWDEQIRIL